MLKPTRTMTVANVSQPLVQASLVGEAIDRGPVLVFVADEDLNYVAVNQYACDILGYTREELLSRKVTDVESDAGMGVGDTEALRAPGSGRSRFQRKDGTVLEIDYRTSQATVAGMALFVSVAFVVS